MDIFGAIGSAVIGCASWIAFAFAAQPIRKFWDLRGEVAEASNKYARFISERPSLQEKLLLSASIDRESAKSEFKRLGQALITFHENELLARKGRPRRRAQTGAGRGRPGLAVPEYLDMTFAAHDTRSQHRLWPLLILVRFRGSFRRARNPGPFGKASACRSGFRVPALRAGPGMTLTFALDQYPAALVGSIVAWETREAAMTRRQSPSTTSRISAAWNCSRPSRTRACGISATCSAWSRCTRPATPSICAAMATTPPRP